MAENHSIYAVSTKLPAIEDVSPGDDKVKVMDKSVYMGDGGGQ